LTHVRSDCSVTPSDCATSDLDQWLRAPESPRVDI
jgi:hypothetical protein